MKLSEIANHPEYFVNEQAELSNRLIPGDPNFKRPEWVQRTLIKNVPILEYFRTSPNDQELVDENGGDWGSADWDAAYIGAAIDVNACENGEIPEEKIAEVLKEFPEISALPFGYSGCTISGLD